MNNACRCALRSYMADCLSKTRSENHLTQAQFSEQLMINPRSYAALEHGESLCCTLTFVLYLNFFGGDVNGIVKDMGRLITEHIAE